MAVTVTTMTTTTSGAEREREEKEWAQTQMERAPTYEPEALPAYVDAGVDEAPPAYAEVQEKVCAVCGASNSATSSFCGQCGRELAAQGEGEGEGQFTMQ